MSDTQNGGEAQHRVPRIVGAPALPPPSPPDSAPAPPRVSPQPRVIDTIASSAGSSAPRRSSGQFAADAVAAAALRQHYNAAAAAEIGRVRRLQQVLAVRDAELQQARERIEVRPVDHFPMPFMCIARSCSRATVQQPPSPSDKLGALYVIRLDR